MLLVLKLYLILPYHLTTLYSRVGETSKSERFRKELWWVVRLQTHTHTHLPACLPLNVALPCVTLENTWTMRGRLVNSIMIQSFLDLCSLRATDVCMHILLHLHADPTVH